MTVGGSGGEGRGGSTTNERASPCVCVLTEECSTRHQIETNCRPINILLHHETKTVLQKYKSQALFQYVDSKHDFSGFFFLFLFFKHTFFFRI